MSDTEFEVIAHENNGVRNRMTEDEINRVYAEQEKFKERAEQMFRLVSNAYDIADVEFGELLVGRWSDDYYFPGTVGGEYIKEDLALWIRVMKRMGAKISKEWPSDDSPYGSVRVVADFSEHPQYSKLKGGMVTALPARNEICERVKVGTRVVTEKVKDQEAVELLTKDIPEIERTREVDVYEWKCEPMLAGTDD